MWKQVVHGLWIGSELGPLQLLTIRSFMAHGFTFHLWTYERLSTPVPHGVVLEDAEDILGSDQIFRYPAGGPIDVPFGAGSYAGFSDIFRYKLLYERGGWYTDMDVTCLKRPDFPEDYVFRDHWLLSAVANIIRCPPGSPLMQRSYELASREVNKSNDDWHKPVRILCRYIDELGMRRFIRPGICNLDDSLELEQKFMLGNEPFPEQWYFVHWCNAMSQKTYRVDSTLSQLLRRYECAPGQWSGSVEGLSGGYL